MFSKLLIAFPAFVIAAAGVSAAELYLVGGEHGLIAAAVLVVFLFLLGLVADAAAKHCLLPNHPVAAVWVMELWALCPGLLAVCAAAGLLVLNVRIGEFFPAGQAVPEAVKALVTALSALVTAGFLKAADDADASWIAPHVRKAFQDKYQNLADKKPGSPAGIYWFTLGKGGVIEACVYETFHKGMEGWGFKARRARAKDIAAALPSEPSK